MSDNRLCRICKQAGHKAVDCPNKDKPQQPKSKGKKDEYEKDLAYRTVDDQKAGREKEKRSSSKPASKYHGSDRERKQQDGPKKCFVCSSEEHRAEDCPALDELQTAFDTLKGRINSKSKITLSEANNVLWQCAKAMERRGALYLFEQMKVAGLKPDEQTYAALTYIVTKATSKDTSRIKGLPEILGAYEQLKEIVQARKIEQDFRALLAKSVPIVVKYMQDNEAKLKVLPNRFKMASVIKKGTRLPSRESRECLALLGDAGVVVQNGKPIVKEGVKAAKEVFTFDFKKVPTPEQLQVILSKENVAHSEKVQKELEEKKKKKEAKKAQKKLKKKEAKKQLGQDEKSSSAPQKQQEKPKKDNSKKGDKSAEDKTKENGAGKKDKKKGEKKEEKKAEQPAAAKGKKANKKGEEKKEEKKEEQQPAAATKGKKANKEKKEEKKDEQPAVAKGKKANKKEEKKEEKKDEKTAEKPAKKGKKAATPAPTAMETEEATETNTKTKANKKAKPAAKTTPAPAAAATKQKKRKSVEGEEATTEAPTKKQKTTNKKANK